MSHPAAEAHFRRCICVPKHEVHASTGRHQLQMLKGLKSQVYFGNKYMQFKILIRCQVS